MACCLAETKLTKVIYRDIHLKAISQELDYNDIQNGRGNLAKSWGTLSV